MGRDLIGGPMRVFQPQSLTKMFTRLLLRVRKAQPRAQERKFLPQLLVPAAPPPFKWTGYYLSTLLGQGDNLAIECFDTSDERLFIKPKYIFFPKKKNRKKSSVARETTTFCCAYLEKRHIQDSSP